MIGVWLTRQGVFTVF